MRMTVVLYALTAGGCGGFRNCETVDTSGVDLLPGRLSEAGLYDDIATDLVSADAIPYEVRFELWADGAAKRRWLVLPPGASIDTSRAEMWDFPVGARLFKEFTRGDVRVETRMIERIDEQRWGAVAYRWEPDGLDAIALPAGEADSSGTLHDIPEAAACIACHGGRESFVLGFAAVQMEPATLADLAAAGALSDDVTADLPGDELDQAALGYLHANCSHCHNPQRDVGDGGAHRCYDPVADIDFTLPPDASSVSATPALRTAKKKLGDDAEHSEVVGRMSRRKDSAVPTTMPPLGTEEVDQDAVDMIASWIDQL